jgi:hypothetical protein
MKEEKSTLSDFDFNFQILEREGGDYAKILNEGKLRRDQLKRLKP